MMTGLQVPSSPYHSVLTGTGIGAGSEARLSKHRLATIQRNKAIFDIENCRQRSKMCRSDGKLKIVPKQIWERTSHSHENAHIDNQRKVERQSTTLRWRVLLLPAAMRAKAISVTRTGFHIDEEEPKLFQIAMVRCQIFEGWDLATRIGKVRLETRARGAPEFWFCERKICEISVGGPLSI
jgi:hypothetical protein